MMLCIMINAHLRYGLCTVRVHSDCKHAAIEAEDNVNS